MSEDVEKHFVLPNFNTPETGTLREVLDNDNTTREKNYLNGLGMTKGESGGISIMLKTVIEVAQDYTVFNYRPPIPQKYLKPQDRTIVAGPGMKPAPKYVLPGHNKDNFGK